MSKLIFSSDALPSTLAPGSRARAWAESLMAGGYNGEAVVPDTESPFTGHVELMAPAGVMLAKSRANSLILTRRPEHIVQDMDDRVTLFFNHGGAAMRTVQMGREMILGAGEGVMVAQDTPQILDGSGSGDVIALILPREPFDAWRNAIHDFAGLRHDFSSSAYRLLRGYSRMLVEEAPGLSDHEVDAVTRHITDLSRSWLGARCEVGGDDGTTRTSRYLAIKTLVRRNLHRADLTPGSIARLLGLSERMVHHVMTLSGGSFGQLVAEMRLRAIHARLIDPAYDAYPIHVLVSSCGFSDYSVFFRRFLRWRGEPPHMLRHHRSIDA